MGTVTCYLDTNILVALLIPEALSGHADTFIQNNAEPLIVSDLAIAEFSSVVARRVRMREFTIEQAGIALAGFDEWLARMADVVAIRAGDVAVATTYIRRLDLTLLTPDALHIAIARRLDATLVTFDRGMAGAARALGMAVATP
ncbi:MAG: type II toxin-antitoxin system VapC family toxin [Stellaceae bacterium]